MPDQRGLLRVLTCGSVDDGKSTLIGRLLYETRSVLADQLATLEQDSKRHGTTGEAMDFALLVDGLQAEREQGITIDVAYRFMDTPRRRFIIADTPGHEQYTRNMVTGASTADLAILLADARQGLLVQTRRHAFICSLLGIRNVILAINKIDLVGFDQARFDEIVADFAALAGHFAFTDVTAIPICARDGDNVTAASPRTPWYGGPSLLDHLEQVPDTAVANDVGFRFPVQLVTRPDETFRGFAGTIASGSVRPGAAVMVAGSNRASTVARVVTMDCDLTEARAADAVTITLADQIDVSRGDMLVDPGAQPETADQFAADVVWMADEPLIPGRTLLVRIGTRTVTGSVTKIKHRIDVNTFEHAAANTLALNEIASCNVSLAESVSFDAYESNRRTGAFIIIDRMTNATVGAGMVRFGLRRASNVHLQAMSVEPAMRAAIKGQRPAVLWFTGLSGAGKSTVANLVEALLHARGAHTTMLDGDNLRHGLTRDLGFTDADRVENIRRVAEVAKLFVQAGVIPLVSFISPFRADRRMARDLLGEGQFLEIFVDTPLDVCRARDPKGLYQKAERGEIKNFTGIDSPYEAPVSPDIHLHGDGSAAAAQAETVVRTLMGLGLVAQ